MINDLPLYISILFGIITLLTIAIFYKASGYSNITLAVLLSWILVQGIISFSGFYTVTDVLPPRFALLALPALAFITGLFIFPGGRRFIDHLDLKTLTALHTIRMPVEGILWALFIYKAVPERMTFEGQNLDIVSGLTAPFVYYWGFAGKRLPVKVLLAWNLICLGLLLNIVVNAVLSAPSPFQQFA